MVRKSSFKTLQFFLQTTLPYDILVRAQLKHFSISLTSKHTKNLFLVIRKHINYGPNLMNTTVQDCFLFKLLMRTKKEPPLIVFQDQDYNLVTKLFHDIYDTPWWDMYMNLNMALLWLVDLQCEKYKLCSSFDIILRGQFINITKKKGFICHSDFYLNSNWNYRERGKMSVAKELVFSRGKRKVEKTGSEISGWANLLVLKLSFQEFLYCLVWARVYARDNWQCKNTICLR